MDKHKSVLICAVLVSLYATGGTAVQLFCKGDVVSHYPELVGVWLPAVVLLAPLMVKEPARKARAKALVWNKWNIAVQTVVLVVDIILIYYIHKYRFI